jgi:steroid delta-isomerase-like uncharacterized protein
MASIYEERKEDSMSTEDNKALVRRWFEELFNQGNLAIADEIVAADHIYTDPSTPGLPPGPAAAKLTTDLYRSAFPDAHITIEDVVAEGDKVVTHWTARGTHKGDLFGVPATGKQATTTGMTVQRVAGAKIAETWQVWDTLGLLQQLGAIPMPGQGGR